MQDYDSKYPEAYGSFKRSAGPVSLQESYNQPHTVTKWTSSKTGLRVVLIDVEGPLCNLFGSVATEIFDDSGCPHTLEHLVFLGSEQYPYKGILDTLANRAFAAGTNAWTDTTNTTYTITTAGEEGFLRILPVYMDHVLYPTLKDTGFTTEVYHVNGKGEDAGVVYSEMQGVENTSYSKMFLDLQRTLYPEGNAYRSQTGGLMEALRKLDIEQIRKYHGSYYLPQNFCLFVTGKVDATKLLKVLTEEVEPTIEQHKQALGPRPEGWKRPFIDTPSAKVPIIAKDRVEVVEFPEKDESMGEVNMSWVGPTYGDFLTEKALDVLSAYLSDSAISPLQKALVEVDDPWATGVGFDGLEHHTSILNISLSSVPKEKLSLISQEVMNVLKRVLKDGIDMDRMTMILHREQRKLLNTLEVDASDSLTYALLTDFLYGAEDSSELPASLDDITRFRTLQQWKESDWGNLLEKYYIERPSLTIIGMPSADQASELRKNNKARLAKRREELGEKGLKRLAEKLDAAQKANDVEPPAKVISDFKIPDVNSIRWINLDSASAGTNPANFSNEVQRHLDQEDVSLPYFMQFEHVHSNFIEISVFLDMADLPAKRELINLYVNVFHSLPHIKEDGSEIPFEDVVKLLETETVDYGIAAGSALSEQLEISIRVEKDKYARAVAWLRDLIFRSKFSEDRLRITAQRLLQNLPAEKREGADVAAAIYRDITLDGKRSSSWSQQLLSRLEATPRIVERLKSEPQKVVQDLEELRSAITSPSRMRIAVTGDIMALDKAKETWKLHFQQLEPLELLPVTFGKDCLSTLGRSPSRKAVIAPLATIESSFGYFVAKGPDTYDHPDLPALTIAKTALNALEGILWRSVRGAGLAYGANIVTDVERGFVYFNVYRSPDTAKAFTESKKALESMIDGNLMPLNEMRIDGAKSELAYYTANSQSSLSKAAGVSFVNQALKGIPQSYQRVLLAKAKDVTVKQVNDAVRKYILPVFEPSTSIAAVTASKSGAIELKEQLGKIGFEAELLNIASNADGESDSGESGDEGSSAEDTDSSESWEHAQSSDVEMK